MSHSEYEGYVRGQSYQLDDTESVDTGAVRDGLINSACHLADESTQVRVSWNMPTGDSPLVAVPAPTTTSAFYYVETFGPFPLTVFQSYSAKLVCRLRGQVSQAGTSTWRLALRPVGPATARPTTMEPGVCEVSTTSTSYADLDPTPGAIQLTRDQVEICRAYYPTLRSQDGSGNPASVLVCLAQLEVWTKTSDVSSIGQLSVVLAREYVGA